MQRRGDRTNLSRAHQAAAVPFGRGDGILKGIGIFAAGMFVGLSTGFMGAMSATYQGDLTLVESGSSGGLRAVSGSQAPLATSPSLEILTGCEMSRETIRLRPATVEDVEILFDIRCSVRQNYQSREELAALGVTTESVAEMIEGGDYVSTMAEVDGRPAGFSMARISEGYIFAAFVRPEFEDRGIGKEIMRAAEEGLRAAGVEEAWLSTGADRDLRAGGFYRHLGWRVAGFLDDGQIIFKKDLRGAADDI